MGKQDHSWCSQHESMASKTDYTYVLCHCKAFAGGLSASTNLLKKTECYNISMAFSLHTAPAQIVN